MRRTLVLLALLLAGVRAQDWVARYSVDMADEARAIVADQAGNCYVAGYAGSDMTGGIALVKYSPYGDTLWTRTRAGVNSYTSGQMAVALEPGGSVLVAAYVIQAPQNGFRLLRYTPAGTQTLDTVFWHSHSTVEPSILDPVSMVVDRSGRIYVSGTTRNDSTGFDIVTCRFDTTGGVVWAKYVDGQRHSTDVGRAMAFSSNGSILVAGYLTDESQHFDAVVLKYDTIGNLVWSYSHRPNTDFQSKASGMGVGAGGEIYIAGWQGEYGQPAGGLLLKLSTSGDSVWARMDSTEFYSVQVDSGGNACVVGQYSPYTARNSIRTWKYGPTGQQLWRRDYWEADPVTSQGFAGLLARDQGVFAVGKRKGSGGRLDYAVERYDPSGNRMWFLHTDTTDRYADNPKAICLDPWGNILVTGKTEDVLSTDQDFYTVKVRVSGAVEEQPATPVEPEHVITASPSVVSSRCRFSVPAGERQSVLSIADIAGRTVRGIPVPSGRTGDRLSVTWDTRDEHGQLVPNGVYFVREQPQATSLKPQATCKVIVQR